MLSNKAAVGTLGAVAVGAGVVFSLLAPKVPTETSTVVPGGISAYGAGVLPDPVKTPGDVMDVTAADVCVPGYAKKVRNVPDSLKEKVYASYGIRTHTTGQYECDHLVGLLIGGSNSQRNLWPQSFTSQPWNAHVKDRLELRLRALVCGGKMSLKDAQTEIRTDWVASYKKHVPSDAHDIPAPVE